MRGGPGRVLGAEGTLLSFNPELASLALDGRVLSAAVVGFEKRYDAEQAKYYVYAVRVQREQAAAGAAAVIFRRFSEFHELHQKLSATTRAELPPFAAKIYVGRSHTRQVSERRQKALHQYLQDLLAMPGVVRDSDVLYAFLHTLPRDVSDGAKQSAAAPFVVRPAGWPAGVRWPGF